ncbi:MAG: PAS domain S-box protein [Methylotenera sp.]
MTHPASYPPNEQARIERLQQLMVLDTKPEVLFDEIAKLASVVCGTPIALISLVDENRQWFKANVGLEGATETHRNLAFCAHAILDNVLMEVPDATLDERFHTNPLVTGDPKIRFYAGAPLTMPGGENIGTLCVINHNPQHLSIYQKAMLSGLANLAVKVLLSREATLNDIESNASIIAAIVEFAQEAIISLNSDSIVTSWNKGAESLFGYREEEIVGKSTAILYPQEKLNEHEFFMGQIKNNQHIKCFETQRRHKSGHIIDISVSLSPIKNAYGKVIGAAEISRGLSEQKGQ